MTDSTLREGDLAPFTGSERFYRHALTPLVYTEGVRYVAEKGGAYWLIDEIGFLQAHAPVAAEPFQHWRLIVRENRSAELVCDDGDGNVVLLKRIPCTDFPLTEIAFYCADRVLMLPGEY